MSDNGYLRKIRNVSSYTARCLGLLPVLDRFANLFITALNRKANRIFVECNPGFPVPPAHLVFDANNTVCWSSYLEGGRASAEIISNIFGRHSSGKAARLLEWGCGPGRIIRHLPDLLGADTEIFGSDYNPESIEWCRMNIRGVTFVENRLAPPLPFDDAFFDCVYGASVLTHLSEEMCKDWVRELGRVTRENGIIVLTTKGETQQARLLERERRKLRNNVPVFRGRAEEGKKMFDTILPTGYVKSVLFADLVLLEHVSAKESPSHHGQDLWVLRNARPGAGDRPPEA